MGKQAGEEGKGDEEKQFRWFKPPLQTKIAGYVTDTDEVFLCWSVTHKHCCLRDVTFDESLTLLIPMIFHMVFHSPVLCFCN